MAETLHISTYPKIQSVNESHKIPLVFLHGWGLNSAVWRPLIDNVSEDFTNVFSIITIDLPGFGLNVDKELNTYTVANICQYIANSVPEPAVYLGWSLGGLVATEMALSYPERVLALITVASSPRFVEEIVEQDTTKLLEWPGIKTKVLANFHRQLQVDTKKTIRGFLKIQAMGCPHSRQNIKEMTQLIFQHDMPSKDTLDKSLKLLEISDYREQIKAISQPFLRLYGSADSLIPKAVIDKISQLVPNSKQHVFKQASHAPFISHVDDFREVLAKWLITKASTHFS